MALLNCAGARETTVVQTVLTASKGVLLILMMMSAAVSLSTAEGREVAEQNLGPGSFEGTSFSGVGPALVGALWAFDGWNGIAFLAEELREPQRLPIIIVVSMGIVSGESLPPQSSYIVRICFAIHQHEDGRLLPFGLMLEVPRLLSSAMRQQR